MNEPSLPQETGGDHLHRAARAALSAIPWVGGAAVELLNKIIIPPVEKRKNAWLSSLAERIVRLEERGYVKADDLSRNDGFISAAMQATQVAMRSHQEEKLEALRNAVVNSAMPGAPEDSKQTMFLSLVDAFTPWHLAVLKFLADPPAWFKGNKQPVPQFGITSSIHTVLQRAFPDLVKDGEFMQLVAKDLHDRKLSGIGNIMLNMSADGALQKGTTDLGDQFLRFITNHTGEAK